MDYEERSESGTNAEFVHPETLDPQWFQELLRKAFDKEVRRLTSTGVGIDEAMERGMWYMFDIRHNMNDLYEAGASEESQ